MPATTNRTSFSLKRLSPSKSVGMRLFLLFFVSSMLLLLTLGYVSYTVARDTVERNALASGRQTVKQTADKLDVVFLRYEDALEQLLGGYAAGQFAGAMAAGPERTEAAAMPELAHWLSGATDATAVYLLPEDPSLPAVYAGAGSSSFASEARSMGWFAEMAGSSGSRWITNEAAGGSGFEEGVFHLAISSGQGYTVVSDIRTAVIEGHLREVNLGEGSYLQLLTGDDKLIASTLDAQADAYLRLGGTLFTDLTEASGSLPTQDEHGNSILAVYGTLENSGWKVLGVVPSVNLVKDADRILETMYVVIIGAAAAALLLGLWMARMVVRPLSRLRGLMSDAAQGRLEVRTDFKSGDEIGELSRSFNGMMEQITELVKHTGEAAAKVLDSARTLGDASRQTAHSAGEIAAATEQIASGASSLSQEADKGNGLAHAIAVDMETAMSAGGEMTEVAATASRYAGEGADALGNLMGKTEQSAGITRELVTKVDALNEAASSVIRVLEVMKAIAQQTNILSLNASIEASRAGEAGQGFLVVATEIRRLADQSNQAIGEVAGIADRIMDEMRATADVLSKAEPLFLEQTEAVGETGALFASVQEQMARFEASLEQTTLSIGRLGHSQRVLTETMENVSAVAQQSSASSEEVASLSGEQQSVSNRLVELAAELEQTSRNLNVSLSRFTY